MSLAWASARVRKAQPAVASRAAKGGSMEHSNQKLARESYDKFLKAGIGT